MHFAKLKFNSLYFTFVYLLAFASNFTHAQCTNFQNDQFDSFEYLTDCPYILPNTTYQTTPMPSPTYGPSRTGARHLYLNFVDNYTGPVFSRPYTVCIGEVYRISFYHKDAWGGFNNVTFNIYDGNDNLLSSNNVTWNGTNWNLWTSPEFLTTTTLLRLEIVNNLADGSNNDMTIDDMSLQICSTAEHKNLMMCSLSGTTNLFDLFSNNVPQNGVWSGPSNLTNGYLGTFDPLLGAPGLYTYASSGSTCTNNNSSVMVTGINPIDLGPDQSHCTVQTVTLDAGPGFNTYNWSTGATTQQISVSTSGTYIINARKLGENLVQHGDFQGGTTLLANNFTSSYVPGTGGTWGLLSNPGQFAISTSPSNTHNNFSFCQDHTGGNGNMYIANGSSTPNTLVWQQTINIEPNQDYLFSYWAMNVVNNNNVSNLQLFINGQPIGNTNATSPISCQWSQVNDTWNSGSATQAVLSIVNQSTAEDGNDFALDDIYFAPYCLVSDTITLTFAAHTLQLTNNVTICEGDSVDLIATASNPIPIDYTYHWNFTASADSIQAVAPTTATTYTVYATSADGCDTPTRTVTVNVSIRPNPNAGLDTTVCLNDVILLNGTISTNLNGRFWSHQAQGFAAPPTIAYTPNTSSLTPSVVVNQPGVYHFILNEQNSICGVFRDTVVITVSQNTHQVSSTDLLCYGIPTGSITIDNSEGFEYSFDNQVTWVQSNAATNLPAGYYTVWSRNQFGCKDSSDITISQPDQLAINVSNDSTICENGTASLNASTPGVTNSLFHWQHTNDTESVQLVQPTTTTTYFVVAEDENSCLSDTLPITITVLDPLSAQLTDTLTICFGDNATLLVNQLSGGISPYNFTWTHGEIGSGLTNQIIVNPTETTSYTVTISDNCESTPITLQTQVIVAALPQPMINAPMVELCEEAVFQIFDVTDPNFSETNQWLITNGQTFTNTESITTDPLEAGSYSITLTVTSSDGCTASTTFNNYLTVHPKPLADFFWNPSPVTMFSTNVNFTNNSELGESYVWTFADGNPTTSTVKDPKVIFPEGQTGEYTVELITISQFGCRDTIEKVVIVLPDVIIYVPNSFTPDGDEYNQTWNVVIDGIDKYDFIVEVYNRWGEKIWESHDSSIGWDGTYRGSIVQAGTCTWVVRAKDLHNDRKYTWNGHLNILR